ncbi:MAG: hypothetical protein K2G25_02270 [Oscillospiraceae bacterium]|nr:hypothetical protein [Oscillospiraceae bacterium]
MDFFEITNRTASDSEAILNHVNDIVACEVYCAQSEIYRTYLMQNREKAELFKQNFRETNDKIFLMSIKILEIAIDMANTELAESALKTIETMRKTYPDFYKAYYRQLF